MTDSRVGSRPVEALRRGRDWLFAGVRNEGERAGLWLPYLLAGLLVVAYPVAQVLTQARFVFGGDMWAEMATNYYVNAHSSSPVDWLFATDAGYFALPQRILAGLAALVGVPAGATPFVYTILGFIGAAVIVGAICLPTFRSVIPSDALRFLLAVLLLTASDFQVRTFINFTYLVVPLAIFMLARAIVDRTPPPRWFWVLPPLMMSKPAVLVVIPAIILAMILGGRRIRWIGGVALALALAQVVRLLLSSSQGGSLLEQSDSSLVERFVNGVRYTVGALARYLAGPNLAIPHPGLLIGGTLAVLAMVALVLLRGRAGALIIIAFSTLTLGMLLNATSFSATFGSGLNMVDGVLLDRRFSVPIWSVIIIVVASLSQLLDSPWPPLARLRDKVRRPVPAIAAVAVLALWVGGSGWGYTLVRSQAPLREPTVGVSTWTDQQAAIDRGEDVCVLVDPIGWVYGPHCRAGNLSPVLYTGPYLTTDSAPLTVERQSAEIRGAAILVRVDGTVRIRLEADGETLMTAEVSGTGEPQMVQLLPEDGETVRSGQRLVLTASEPVDVWQAGDAPAVVWLVRD